MLNGLSMGDDLQWRQVLKWCQSVCTSQEIIGEQSVHLYKCYLKFVDCLLSPASNQDRNNVR